MDKMTHLKQLCRENSHVAFDVRDLEEMLALMEQMAEEIRSAELRFGLPPLHSLTAFDAWNKGE